MKVYLGNYLRVEADKIEWTPGNPKWIWHVRCDRCPNWPGRTARSQKQGLLVAANHYEETHLRKKANGLREGNQESTFRTRYYEVITSPPVNGSKGSNNGLRGDSKGNADSSASKVANADANNGRTNDVAGINTLSADVSEA